MEDEPEPCPAGAKVRQARGGPVPCEALLRRHIALCMQTHFQLLQLAADVACADCYFSPCAPFFVALADKAKLQAGLMMDAVLKQGGSVELPAILTPCPNLAHDAAEGEQTLAAALEACIQLEGAKGYDSLCSDVLAAKGNAAARQLVDALSLESLHTRAELTRLLASVRASRDKLAALSYCLARTAP